jgi:hypothetical protein
MPTMPTNWRDKHAYVLEVVLCVYWQSATNLIKSLNNIGVFKFYMNSGVGKMDFEMKFIFQNKFE